MTAAIYQLQKKQDAKFICSACGADRTCDCNAPAVERLTEIREKARQEKRRQRQKSKENNNHVRQTDDDVAVEPLSKEQVQTALIVYAGTAVELAEKIKVHLHEDGHAINEEVKAQIARAAAAWAGLDQTLGGLK